MAAIPRYVEIRDFKELAERELTIPLKEGEKGYLCLDMDHTMLEPVITLAGDRFADFVQTHLCPLLPHLEQRQTLFQLCERIKAPISYLTPYQPTDRSVVQVVQRFREAGWFVRIVTNRSQLVAQAAVRHLQETGFHDIPLEHCDFQTVPPVSKGVRIQKLMGDQKGRVVFVDDSIENLRSVAEVGLQARCYRYLRPPLTQEEQDHAFVHLYDFRENLPFHLCPSKEEVAQARKALQIDQSKDLFPLTFLMALLNTGEKRGLLAKRPTPSPTAK